MRVLEVCVDLDGGGIDRYLLNYCSRIKDIQFDFVVVDNKIGILEPEIEAFGARIFRVPRQSSGIKKNYTALKKIMTENKYDAVHVHLGYKGAIALLCAKMCGVKARIVHAHIAYEPESLKQKIIRKVFTVITKCVATSLAACGVDAAKWVWGENAYNKGKVKIHNNAIQTEKYAYSVDARNEVRKEFNIEEDTFVVGHVGRLCSQKNQLRLLDIFSAIESKRPNTVLLLVGRGELEDEIRIKAAELGIEDKVRLLGVRDDVYKLLSAFDCFVFPSTHEGLPFTLIETQCNGLFALSADTVTPDVRLGDCVEFMSLAESDQTWAEKVLLLCEKRRLTCGAREIKNAGYDITVEAEKLKEFYFEQVKKRSVIYE